MYREIDEFENLVERALKRMPPEFMELLDNVAILVEDWPDYSTPLAEGRTLYGLYEGIPLTQRGTRYSGALPDRITIFQGPLERDFPPEMLEKQVRVTVVHEIAHHFGIDDDQLYELGWA